MYAATSLRDAYRKFRSKDPSYVCAFGQKVTMVARSVNAHGKVSYRFPEKFGEGGAPA